MLFFAEGETAQHREDLQPAEKGMAFVSNTTDELCFFCKNENKFKKMSLKEAFNQ